ncbi:sphingoid base-phosphate phosphatase [Aspergillus campestris IBT 28561]|uniref:Sphingoid base-phosphate phosphatase n=1 Tax=Aspergillus campestris (strain IBT 28561) TaxID=1392248 RepID=A0A2I1CR02_ASPC2|nr:sphingoid base-phosphate phosphatase [Aspergillus campestris IBT 28561]PKY00060.1 sphingoid base-phosphate phosphatase [Aspergillus campestris IBT 28561]
MSKEANGRPDAGLRSLNHYRNQLPAWRYWPRQKLLPLVRYETPYLAWVQEKVRTPTLDSYFAFTANLGTHTFFMVFLPLFFWSGYPDLGRAMTRLLASGVFFSGFIKDLLCLPRPLSPPLQRISMSGSAALEYGFPSTHSTNAVSVAVYALAMLGSSESTLDTRLNLFLQGLTYLYVTSIVLGRLYCGMHGFSDVIVGCGIGALLAFVQSFYGYAIDGFSMSANGTQVFVVVLVILALVRLHPEPADDCPCFDDSVSFAGVMIGVQLGCWHVAKLNIEWDGLYPPAQIDRLEELGLMKSVLRLLLGVLLLFVWRGFTKPFLLRVLPPIFRGLEKLGLILPRRFFTQASQYTRVPAQLKDHDLLPNFSEIPSILTNIRHPRRRAISVGPQSEADAYETLAYREKRRRESLSGNRAPVANDIDRVSPAGMSRIPSRLNEYENMMGTGSPRVPPGGGVGTSPPPLTEPFPPLEPEEPNEEEVFAQIKRPRVRYDVEVVTKLVVYSGIGWVVIEIAPLIFDMAGLVP